MTELPPMMTEPTESKPGRTMAIVALVLSICGIIPCIGAIPCLIGIILGIVALATSRPGKGLAVGAIAAGGALLVLSIISPLLISILLPSLNRAKELAKRASCSVNVKGIVNSVVMYSHDRGREILPPTLQYVIDEDFLKEESCICPSSGNEEPFDYFYLPSARGLDGPGTGILACDFRDNHQGKGRNVGYWDGSVRWLEEDDFQAELALPHNAAFAAALKAAEAER